MIETKKKRGVLLTIWLILILISNFFTAISFLVLNLISSSNLINTSSWIFYIYGALALANIIFAIFLFKWKKWAFYAFCASAIIAFILNLSMGIGIVGAILGIMGPLILYLIMKSTWDLFE